MLPDLPKQIKKREANFGLTFRAWWVKNPLRGEIELKDTRGKDSIAFSEFSQDQEIVGLAAIGKKGILVRRESGTIGGADYSGLLESPYWIVIKYPREFHVISLTTFLLEKKRSKRKSLVNSRAREISVVSVKI